MPIVGAAVAIVLPALFALVQFGWYAQALMLLGGLFAITFLVGNILLPRMQGDSLNMDPLVVLMSLGFWGAIWGLPGMFLSTPLTVLIDGDPRPVRRIAVDRHPACRPTAIRWGRARLRRIGPRMPMPDAAVPGIRLLVQNRSDWP